MQTFLPYPNFNDSAKCLDYRRLGKQRIETWQIYQALKYGKGWSNHPITKMWKGCELSLLTYGIVICNEWINRNYKDTMLIKFQEAIKIESNQNFKLPTWFGNPDFHASHRSNLLRKNKEYYSKYNWSEPDNLPYIWY